MMRVDINLNKGQTMTKVQHPKVKIYEELLNDILVMDSLKEIRQTVFKTLQEYEDMDEEDLIGFDDDEYETNDLFWGEEYPEDFNDAYWDD